ncbi:MAG: hypothetical protein DRJ01_12930 [Bacteroidetes bacterium]|nr:MAG: hypothetical protein DRJ01_12930 [Bacteroidota bacterium]
MKNRSLFLITIILIGLLGFSSCSDKTENKSPLFESLTVADNNKTVTVTFSEPVFANADQTGNLDSSDIIVTIPGVDFTYSVTHTAGSSSMTVGLTITSITDGTETITIKPASVTSIYDNEGKAMDVTETIVSESIAKDLGIIGKWYSSGDNVAPLLVTYFAVDSIYAEFKDDNTYSVEQYNSGNTSGEPDFIFTGTFTIEKSTTGEIWTINLTQELPYAAEASGIFEVKQAPEVLWYEVVQTSGTQNTPPTPEEGFGSSNGGSLGTSNIQKYIRIAE